MMGELATYSPSSAANTFSGCEEAEANEIADSRMKTVQTLMKMNNAM